LHEINIRTDAGQAKALKKLASLLSGPGNSLRKCIEQAKLYLEFRFPSCNQNPELRESSQ
jgi:hypothetical protein